MRISDCEMQNILRRESVFVAVDIETTGFSMSKGAEIIEIGAARIDAPTKKVIAKYQSFIKPYQAKLKPEIQELTGISPKDLVDARPADIVIPEFASFIGSDPIIFSNASFDWDRFLDQMLRKQGIVKNNPIIDTQIIAKMSYPHLKKYNLKAMCEFFGAEIVGHHRAYSDAKHTAAVAIRIRESLDPQIQIPISIKEKRVEKKALPPFKIHRVRPWNKSKTLKRIYFTTSWGSIYYDIIKKTWFIQNTPYEVTIDLDYVESEVLKMLRIEIREDLEELFYQQIEPVVG